MFRQEGAFVNVITAINGTSRHYGHFGTGVDEFDWAASEAQRCNYSRMEP